MKLALEIEIFRAMSGPENAHNLRRWAYHAIHAGWIANEKPLLATLEKWQDRGWLIPVTGCFWGVFSEKGRYGIADSLQRRLFQEQPHPLPKLPLLPPIAERVRASATVLSDEFLARFNSPRGRSVIAEGMIAMIKAEGMWRPGPVSTENKKESV